VRKPAVEAVASRRWQDPNLTKGQLRNLRTAMGVQECTHLLRRFPRLPFISSPPAVDGCNLLFGSSMREEALGDVRRYIRGVGRLLSAGTPAHIVRYRTKSTPPLV
jgi:hypothetical protein